MALTAKQQKKCIKWMIKTFYNNFAWRELDSVFWKKQDKCLNEFLEEEYPKYTLTECYTALNTMLYNRQLIIKEDSKSAYVEVHWMKMQRFLPF